MEQPLQLAAGSTTGGTPRALAGWVLHRGVPAFVAEDRHRLGQVERPVRRVGRDGREGLAAVQLLVGESPVLPAEYHCHRALGAPAGQLVGCFPGIQRPALGGPLPRGQSHDEDAVLDCLLQALAAPDSGDQIAGVVGDALDAIGIVDPGEGPHHPQVFQSEVFRDSNRAGEVDDVLGLDQHQDRRTAHPSPRNEVSRPRAFSKAAKPSFSVARR